MLQVEKRAFLLVQSEHLSIDRYYGEFKVLVAVIETYSRIFFELGVIKKELTDASITLKQDSNGDNMTMVESANKPALDAAIKIVREKSLPLMLLNGPNYK